ncbi:MAG: hypothetical protein AAFX93_01605 [Verrucomicrobiota bacterium]
MLSLRMRAPGIACALFVLASAGLGFSDAQAQADTVSCSSLPTTIPPLTSYTVELPYTASQSRDVVVELWGATWLNTVKQTVQAGSGTATITIPLSIAPAEGSNYLWKASIRPVGADWTQNIVLCDVPNVTVANLTDAVDCSLLPTNLEPQTSYTVSVPYTASGPRDVIVEFWGDTWLNAVKQTVQAGTGTAAITIPLSAAPPEGTNYLWKASIRPVGTDWTQNTNACSTENVIIASPTPTEDLVSCSELPGNLEPQTSYTFSVPYTASQSRDIVVELWGNTWLANGTTTVQAGEGTASVTVNLSQAPAAGSNYELKTAIRPVGTNWTQNLNVCNRADIVVAPSTPTTDTVSCASLPSSLQSQTSYTVSVPYTASQSRDIVIEFWNDNWLGAQTTTVSAGEGTASVTVNLADAPGNGTNYLWKASIRPLGTDWTQNLNACSLPNVAVSGASNLPLGAYIEQGGIVIIDPENGDLGSSWVARPTNFPGDPSMAGSLGNGWLEWTGAQFFGNTKTESEVTGILTYTFVIETEGEYHFRWRTKQYNVGTFDAGNDSYVSFNSGTPVAGFQDFSLFTKAWVQSKASWSWRTTFEPHHGEHYADNLIRRYYTPGVHTIQIAARSPGHSIDRIAIFRTSIPFNASNFENAPESDRVGSSVALASFGAPQTVAINPSDDAYLQGSSAFNNNQLRVAASSPTAYLKFNVTGVSGNVTGSKLVLNVSDDAGSGTIRVHEGTSNNWSESNLTSVNAPANGAELGSVTGSFSVGSTIEIDLGNALSNGVTSLIVSMDGGGNNVWLSSKEGTVDPVLEVTYQP